MDLFGTLGSGSGHLPLFTSESQRSSLSTSSSSSEISYLSEEAYSPFELSNTSFEDEEMMESIWTEWVGEVVEPEVKQEEMEGMDWGESFGLVGVAC